MLVLSNMHKGKIYVLRIRRHSKRKSFFLSLGLTLFLPFSFFLLKSDNIVDVDSEGALDVYLWFVARLNKIISDLIKLSGGFWYVKEWEENRETGVKWWE